MPIFRAGEKEKQFANIIWDLAPVKTSELARIAERQFGWARSTMYTVLRRLIDKEIFTNKRGTVIANVSREEFEAGQSQDFVDYAFDGSLPMFLRAYHGKGRGMSDEERELLEELLLDMELDRLEKRKGSDT